MIQLYTEQYLPTGRIKLLLKRMVGKTSGGPFVVCKNLMLGLYELKYPYTINQSPQQGAVACVLNGVAVLAWAIKQKKKGVFKHIVAGPNVLLTPLDSNNLAQSPEIDMYVVPANWTQKWWAETAPALAPRLQVWASGVPDNGELVKADGQCLLYWKTGPQELFEHIKQTLQNNHISYTVCRYGSYTEQQWRAWLAKTKFAIFVSESESQGLALHEAWMAGVPTLVWNCGVTRVGDFSVSDSHISAPYLTPACGSFFSGTEDFEYCLKTLLSVYTTYTPRRYSLEHFTVEASAQRYLSLIQSL